MIELIDSFFDRVRHKEVEIYNEFSLQHELGVHLRTQLRGSKVEFERPVTFWGLERPKFAKAEIDITIYKDKDSPEAAIELKFPRAGQYPEQMLSSLRDICFLQQLVAAKFSAGYFVFVADDPGFYGGKSEGIYQFFRGGAAVTGEVFGPTGDTTRSVKIVGEHRLTWKDIEGQIKYFIVLIAPAQQ